MNSIKLLIAVALVAIGAFLIPYQQPAQALYYTSYCVSDENTGCGSNFDPNCFTRKKDLYSYPYTCCETSWFAPTKPYQGVEYFYECTTRCGDGSGGRWNDSHKELLHPGGYCPPQN